MKKAFLQTALAILATLLASAVAVAQQSAPYDPATAAGALADIRTRVEDPELSQAQLAQLRTRVAAEELAAQQCEVAATADRARLEVLYEPLKGIDGDADPTVFEQFLDIKGQLDAAIARQTVCANIIDQSQQLVAAITGIQNQRSDQFLSNRGRNIFQALFALPARVAELPEIIKRNLTVQLAEGIAPILLFWVLLGGGALAALAGVFIRHRFYVLYRAADGDDGPPRFKYLFPKPLADHAPFILEGVTLAALLYAATVDGSLDDMVVRLPLALALYGIVCVVIDWATGPLSPSASVQGLIPDHVAPLRRRLRIWAITLAVSFVLLGTRWLVIPTISLDVTGRVLTTFLVASALLYVLAYLPNIPGLQGRFRLIRSTAVVVLLAGIGALLLGFHNFAAYLINGMTRTALALFLLWTLLWSVQALFQHLTSEETRAAHHLRSGLGLTEKSARTSLGLVQLVADLAIWVGFLMFVLYVWDDAGTTVGTVYEKLNTGFTVGEINLNPRKIVGGVLAFSILVIIIGWVKNWIDRRWLQQIVTDRGAREALVTLFGYIGFVAAGLIGLTTAGIDLTGLAFVSAALALGIGFGMQEIASNFVSGLILLFERPIRSGDFVTVGGTDGFVRSIRIRATEIETLDNQNVLVPNSELVSGRVTNWVLRDTAGRLQLRVGVAYGSDVELVREILERIGHDHSEVITDGNAPAPRALFMGFGDSSLDFELRLRVYRIDRRFTVLSDLNFAIDREFRNNGITIPFPQRDLHIISDPKAPGRPNPAKSEPISIDSESSSPVTVTREHTEEVEIPASAEKVWQALTDVDMQTKWLVDDSEFDPRIGGRFRFKITEGVGSLGATAEGKIDVFIPNYRMRLVVKSREREGPLPTGPLTVDIRLRGADGKTRVQVTAGGFPAEEDWEEDFKWSINRWKTCLESLRDLLSG